VLFIDVVDSVRLIQHDQEGTIQRWRNFTSEVTADDLPRFRGRLVKMPGDGCCSDSKRRRCASSARLRCGRIERGEAGVAREQRIRLRMGVHLADVIVTTSTCTATVSTSPRDCATSAGRRRS
jgi:class 3 adenylate cyclase